MTKFEKLSNEFGRDVRKAADEEKANAMQAAFLIGAGIAATCIEQGEDVAEIQAVSKAKAAYYIAMQGGCFDD